MLLVLQTIFSKNLTHIGTKLKRYYT